MSVIPKEVILWHIVPKSPVDFMLVDKATSTTARRALIDWALSKPLYPIRESMEDCGLDRVVFDDKMTLECESFFDQLYWARWMALSFTLVDYDKAQFNDIREKIVADIDFAHKECSHYDCGEDPRNPRYFTGLRNLRLLTFAATDPTLSETLGCVDDMITAVVFSEKMPVELRKKYAPQLFGRVAYLMGENRIVPEDVIDMVRYRNIPSIERIIIMPCNDVIRGIDKGWWKVKDIFEYVENKIRIGKTVLDIIECRQPGYVLCLAKPTSSFPVRLLMRCTEEEMHDEVVRKGLERLGIHLE